MAARGGASNAASTYPALAPASAPDMGPLPIPKTITITIVPDSTSVDAESLVVVFGPDKTTPEHATCKFTLKIKAPAGVTDEGDSKQNHEVIVPKGQRCLLWYNDKPFPGYAHAVETEGCRLSCHDELKMLSVVLRRHSSPTATDNDSLRYIRNTPGSSSGYMRLIQGYHYYLNFTFAAGSFIAQRVGNQAWRPMCYLMCAQGAGVKQTCVFTNFVTRWADHTELEPDDGENKQVLVASQQQQQVQHSCLSSTHSLQQTFQQSQAAMYQSALAPINLGSKVDSTLWKTETRYQDVVWMLHHKRLHRSILPVMDSKTPPPPFPLTSCVDRFWNSSDAPIVAVMRAMEAVARNASTNLKDTAHYAAKLYWSLTIALTQLVGWQQFALYVNTNTNTKTDNNTKTNAKPNTNANGTMSELQDRGQGLLLHVCRRMEWKLMLMANEHKAFDADLCVKLIAADKQWTTDVTCFLKTLEAKVAELLNVNAAQFQLFRESQRNGVQWPHSAAVRRCVEAAGFTYRPMMLKRDRCICETCGVEVYGWRPWHDPMSFHDFSKHPPSFTPPMLMSATSLSVSQFVTDTNLPRPSN